MQICGFCTLATTEKCNVPFVCVLQGGVFAHNPLLPALTFLPNPPCTGKRAGSTGLFSGFRTGMTPGHMMESPMDFANLSGFGNGGKGFTPQLLVQSPAIMGRAFSPQAEAIF